jgi:polar amino acid transport system permease protein
MATRSFTSAPTQLLLWRGTALLVIVLLAGKVVWFHWAAVAPSWLFLLTALGRSWLLAVASAAVGAVLAVPLAIARAYGPWAIRYLATGLIEAVRATPELMIIFWVYFTWPLIASTQVSAWNAALGSLVIIAAAYLAEVIRAGLYSVPIGQVEAGIACGLSRSQTFVLIVFPQVLRNMLPALMAQLVALFKTTSLVYAIGVMDFFRAVNITASAVFAPYALYMVLGMGYFISCFAITRLIRHFDPKYQLLQ